MAVSTSIYGALGENVHRTRTPSTIMFAPTAAFSSPFDVSTSNLLEMRAEPMIYEDTRTCLDSSKRLTGHGNRKNARHDRSKWPTRSSDVAFRDLRGGQSTPSTSEMARLSQGIDLHQIIR
jgi:hypothetical protein